MAFAAAPQALRTQQAPRKTCATRMASPVSSQDVAASLVPGVACVLSHFEAARLLPLQKGAGEALARVEGPFLVDLGMRTVDGLMVGAEGVAMGAERGVFATWSELARMAKKGKTGAFECYGDGISQPVRIAGLSEVTGRAASLLPCGERVPPTVVLAGFGMHRLKDTDPGRDTDAKVAAIGREWMRGCVLDVCSGLGYTAIAAADVNAVREVVTIEVDDAIVEIQRRNPWSKTLFTHPKITRLEDDATDILPSLPAGAYNVVIHDPPAQAMAGELYSAHFYRQLRRVCARGAKLFHYIGDPTSQESGRLFRGVMSRLQDAGFRDVQKTPAAFGVTAYARGNDSNLS